MKVSTGNYTPYYYVGDGQRVAFVRVGDESLPATAEQMVRLVLKGSNKTFDSLHTDYKVENTKALEGYKDELKPKFKSTPTQFQTIIFAFSDTLNVGSYDGNVSETKLTERQQKIIVLVKESPTISGRQMSEILSVSQRTIERDLSTMQKNGILKHEGKDNNGSWQILITME